MASKIPRAKLNDGNYMPMIGLGTWKSQPGEVLQAVKDAIDIGYRHIDCAYAYQNEGEVGQAIIEKISERVVKREELFIVSKLWHSFHDPEHVEEACRTSMALLKVDYLDLYLIHYPSAFAYCGTKELVKRDANGDIVHSDVDYVDTWKAMEKLVEIGLVKSIGISNFNHFQIERVLEVAKIKPVTNQVECHPYLSQKKLADWMAERGILLTSYSPLGSPDRPRRKEGDKTLLDDPALPPLAVKYNKTPAQILLRYHVERGFPVIPKSVSKNRIAENFNIFDFELSHEDMKTLMDLNFDGRYLSMEMFGADRPYYPFKEEF